MSPNRTVLTRAARVQLAALLLATVVLAVPVLGSAGHAGAGEALATVPHLADPDVGRRPVPEDVYAMALGCYELANVATGAVLGREGGRYADGAANPFHFEPTALGTYLLLDVDGAVVAAAGGPAEQVGAGLGDVERVAPAGRTTDVPRSARDDAPPVLVDDPVDGLPRPDTHTGAVVPGEAGPSADWRARMNPDGSLTFTLDAASGRALAVVDGAAALVADSLSPAAAFRLRSVDEAACAEWPEIEVGVEGPVLAGEAPWAETRGYVDGHLHLMAYEFLGGEFRCGRPWHRYGVEQALRDCADNEFAGGRLAEVGFGDGPQNAGDDVFWPEFTVPTPRSKTYEQVYHRWLERAWRGGLRMMTVLMVENNVLCEVWPEKRNSCNEMDSVRLQVQRLHELVDYIDARAGGPGEGWAEVVTDPFEARRAVNEGKLAFVMGIEVSVLFDCREHMGTSRCTDADIIRQLDEVRALGITQVQLVNKFDNALSGVKGDPGTTGVAVNLANRDDTGHFWQMGTCPEGRGYAEDHLQLNLPDGAAGSPAEPVVRDPLAGEVLQAVGASGVAPAYPEGPHCNTIGLTRQGELLLTAIAARGMVFDPDHMSALGAMQALDVMERLGHHGVFSSHGWSDDLVYERIYRLGGTVTQYAGNSDGFVAGWRRTQDWVDDRFYFGYGYGADTNGLGGQGSPRNPGEDADVDYPFAVPGGAVVHQQVSGTRAPYDVNVDGVAHYGLYPDWVEDLRVQAGDAIVTDLLRGPEAYLQMWERAVGVGLDACTFGDGTTDPTDALAPGTSWDEVLRTAGQPRVRDTGTWVYCGVDRMGRASHVTVTFDDTGAVADVQERPAVRDLPGVNAGRTPVAADATGRSDVSHAHGDGHAH
jgi:microsomal dipeptidase-like Zn-dependent dipeptidase